MMATALIVEDEPVLCRDIRGLLEHLWPELEIVGEARDGADALRKIAEHRPAIVFLDIQIPLLNGLEVAREVGGRCHVVFITAYDAHAVEAFEKGAVDYILKPVHEERLALTVQRLQKKLHEPPADMHAIVGGIAQSSRSSYLRWITSNTGKTFKVTMTEEVVYFQADNRYTRVVLADSEQVIARPLKELLAELDPEQFWQIHRSTIVNVAQIASIEPNLAGRLSVKLKSRREWLPVSDSFMRRFRQM